MATCTGCGATQADPEYATYIVVGTGVIHDRFTIGKGVMVDINEKDQPVALIFECAPRDITRQMLQEVEDFRLTSRYRLMLETHLAGELHIDELCSACVDALDLQEESDDA